MTHRAFCDDLSEGTIVLTDSEAHHVVNVLRLARGAELDLFDGRGHEAKAIVSAISRRDVTCERISVCRVEPPTRPVITVVASPPKGDRLRWMVEKLTEIGVDRLLLLHADRTIVTPGETRFDKLRDCVIGACKQCRRSYLMELSSPVPLKKLISEREFHAACTSVLIAHPGDASSSVSKVLDTIPRGNDLTVLIGPEGGFTAEEAAMATAAGILPAVWPATILRIETAALVFATAMLCRSV